MYKFKLQRTPPPIQEPSPLQSSLQDAKTTEKLEFINKTNDDVVSNNKLTRIRFVQQRINSAPEPLTDEVATKTLSSTVNSSLASSSSPQPGPTQPVGVKWKPLRTKDVNLFPTISKNKPKAKNISNKELQFIDYSLDKTRSKLAKNLVFVKSDLSSEASQNETFGVVDVVSRQTSPAILSEIHQSRSLQDSIKIPLKFNKSKKSKPLMTKFKRYKSNDTNNGFQVIKFE